MRRFFLPLEKTSFYALFLIPLVTYIPVNRSLSLGLRVSLFFAISMLLFATTASRQNFAKEFRSLHPLAKLLGLVILVGVIVSSVRSITNHTPIGDIVFGLEPEFLGLIVWGSIGILAVGLRSTVRRYIFSPSVLIILLLGIVASLCWEIYYLIHGFRLEGLLYQSTSFALYCCLALHLAIYQLAKGKSPQHRVLGGAGAFLGALAVILSQSRVGLLALLLLLLLWGVRLLKTKPAMALPILGCLVIAALAPVLQPTFFARMNSSKVSKGIEYRSQLYSTTLPDLMEPGKLFGNGPNTIPQAINNQNKVPEDIAKTLREGEIFGSTHNLYLDFVYLFGWFAALSLIGLTILGLVQGLRRFLDLSVLFIILGFNALLNVPSFELTGLYFVVLLAIVGNSQQSVRQYLRSWRN